VLFERPGRHAGQVLGRSPYLQAVHADGPQRLIGQIVPVKITSAAKNSLGAAVSSFAEGYGGLEDLSSEAPTFAKASAGAAAGA
jgi:tRNA-2-methylthio-N6-dimethylallyladenosine synthase